MVKRRSSILDFSRLRGHAADTVSFVKISRAMTLVWGLVLMGFGLVKWGPLLEAGLTVVALPLASLLGLFLLGMIYIANMNLAQAAWEQLELGPSQPEWGLQPAES